MLVAMLVVYSCDYADLWVGLLLVSVALCLRLQRASKGGLLCVRQVLLWLRAAGCNCKRDSKLNLKLAFSTLLFAFVLALVLRELLTCDESPAVKRQSRKCADAACKTERGAHHDQCHMQPRGLRELQKIDSCILRAAGTRGQS